VSNGLGTDAGDLVIWASGDITLNSSELLADASVLGAGETQAGAVDINANNLTLKNSSFTSVRSTNEGKAGNINIQANTVILNAQSELSALSYFEQGGNIKIDSNNTVLLDDSRITATSLSGQDGTVQIDGNYAEIKNFDDYGSFRNTRQSVNIAYPSQCYGYLEKNAGSSLKNQNQFYDTLPLTPWTQREFWPVPDFAESNAGIQAYQRGDFQQAIKHWQQQLDTLVPDSNQAADIKLALVAAHRQVGLAVPAMQLAKELWLNESLSKTQRVSAGIMLVLLQNLTKNKQSQATLKVVKTLVQNTQVPADLKTALNQFAPSIDDYFETKADTPVKFKLLLNILLTKSTYADYRSRLFIRKYLPIAEALVLDLPMTYDSAMDILSLIELKANSNKHQGQKELLDKAQDIAEQLQNPRLLSWAYGFYGLWEDNKHQSKTGSHQERLENAKHKYRKAIFYAQQKQAQAPVLSFLWHSKLAYLLAQDETENKTAQAYSLALEALKNVRLLLIETLGCEFVNNKLELTAIYRDAIYYELNRINELSDSSKQGALINALDLIEEYQRFEVENYFQDICLSAAEQNNYFTEELPLNTAVLYPFIIENNLFLIFRHGKTIKLSTKTVDASAIENHVNELLSIAPRVRQTQREALYTLLVEPMNQQIDKYSIDTLVVVPGYPFYNLSFAGLHDGTDYLVKKPYAIVQTPALSLTQSAYLQATPKNALFAGLGQVVSGFEALTHVYGEIKSSENQLSDYEIEALLDDMATTSRLKAKLDAHSYPLLHLATHVSFDKNFEQSFILFSDKKLYAKDLNGLFSLLSTPLDLMVLSACDTAKSDSSRSALGLAGMAAKTGAVSVLATLLKVQDEFAAKLTPAFYKHWQEEDNSKAKALQLAQQEFLEHPIYHHPSYWASFILVGHW